MPVRDLDTSGQVDELDADQLRAHLVDPVGAPLAPGALNRCQVVCPNGGCGLVEVAVLLRNLAVPPLAPPIEPVCSDAAGI